MNIVVYVTKKNECCGRYTIPQEELEMLTAYLIKKIGAEIILKTRKSICEPDFYRPWKKY
jgi:hypothetical protein